MRIRRSRPSVEWTQIPNVVARDYRLSWRARGLLLELLSYPPGWETTIDELVRRAQRQAAEVGGRVEGRDAMRAAARELKAAGYLVVTKQQDERGRWRTTVEVTDAPMWELLADTGNGIPGVGATSADTPVSAGRTEDGIPGVGNPAVGKPGVSIKKEKKNDPPPSARRDAQQEEEEQPEEQPQAAALELVDAAEIADPGQDASVTAEEQPQAAALELVDAAVATWAGHRPPTPQERLRLAERAAQALREGAPPDTLIHALSRDLSGARSAVAVVMARTAAAGWWRGEAAPAATAAPPRPEWCGVCDERTRQREDGQGRPYRCPDCHPLQAAALTP